MAIGSPNLTIEQKKEQEDAAKIPVAKTEAQATHLGIKPQKGAKKME